MEFYLKTLTTLVAFIFTFNTFALSIDQIKKNNHFSVPISFYENGEINKAIEALQNLKKEDSKEAHRHFLISKFSLDLSYFDQARKHIDQAIELNIDLKDYAYFIKGLIEWESRKNLDDAITSFNQALKLKPLTTLKNDINYYLAKTYFLKKNFEEAKPLLENLRRSFRFDKRKPEVIRYLLSIYKSEKDNVNFCKWSRHIYANFPFNKYISHWDINLHNNTIDKQSTQCYPTYSEKRRRIKKLLWAGKDKKAKNDIATLKKSNSVSAKDIDRLTAEYLLHIGDVEDALKLLLRNFETVQKDFDYLMLLGTAAYKAGEYQTAVGTYHKAFKLKPKSQKGKTALFRSAFLSYQFQDYDGATRKYQQFIKNYPGSTLVKDSMYHIAWMKYLRGHYKLAIEGFEKILAERKKSRHGWRKYPTDRIQYWLAMSYHKLKEDKIAWHILKHLADNRNNSYYSFAAQSRLSKINYDPGALKIGGSNEVREPATTMFNVTSALENAQINNTFFIDPLADNETDNLESGDESLLNVDNETAKVFWSKPKIQENIARVETLIEMGQNDWAYRDLKLIESHVKDRSLYNQFIKNYRQLKKYTRSSYLTELKIMPKFTKQNLKTNYDVWQMAYPQAFKETVNKYSKLYSVPNKFVWSIMRAESRYNPSAESPVGAKGLMQIMPYTARHLLNLLNENTKQSMNLHNPKTNIKLGTRYLNRLLGKFKNQMPLAAAAYNAGPHRVKSWVAKFGNLELDEFIEHIPFVETRNYVKRVTRFYGVYKKAYDKDHTPMGFLAKNIPYKHKGPIPTKEDWN